MPINESQLSDDRPSVGQSSEFKLNWLDIDPCRNPIERDLARAAERDLVDALW